MVFEISAAFVGQFTNTSINTTFKYASSQTIKVSSNQASVCVFESGDYKVISPQVHTSVENHINYQHHPLKNKVVFFCSNAVEEPI